MLTMLISVLWFGHKLNTMQMVGVACVFGGVFLEGELGKREKAAKAKAQAAGVRREAGGREL
jgi:UDP-galactose transporter B1